MAEEKITPDTITSSDDVNVLRELLHTIHGLSPVSSPSLLAIAAEADNGA